MFISVQLHKVNTDGGKEVNEQEYFKAAANIYVECSIENPEFKSGAIPAISIPL